MMKFTNDELDELDLVKFRNFELQITILITGLTIGCGIGMAIAYLIIK